MQYFALQYFALQYFALQYFALNTIAIAVNKDNVLDFSIRKAEITFPTLYFKKSQKGDDSHLLLLWWVFQAAICRFVGIFRDVSSREVFQFESSALHIT